MSGVPVWESPSEYDRRKLAPLDFAPVCEVEDCASHVGRAVQCTKCNAIRLMICVPHSEGIPESLPENDVRCEECDGEGTPDEVIRMVSLAWWT